jgi:hypothetical protein
MSVSWRKRVLRKSYAIHLELFLGCSPVPRNDIRTSCPAADESLPAKDDHKYPTQAGIFLNHPRSLHPSGFPRRISAFCKFSKKPTWCFYSLELGITFKEPVTSTHQDIHESTPRHSSATKANAPSTIREKIAST